MASADRAQGRTGSWCSARDRRPKGHGPDKNTLSWSSVVEAGLHGSRLWRRTRETIPTELGSSRRGRAGSASGPLPRDKQPPSRPRPEERRRTGTEGAHRFLFDEGGPRSSRVRGATSTSVGDHLDNGESARTQGGSRKGSDEGTSARRGQRLALGSGGPSRQGGHSGGADRRAVARPRLHSQGLPASVVGALLVS